MQDFLTNNLSDFTVQEIRKAFELAIAGELQVDIQHYNSFDLKYICQILNAYRTKRNTVVSNQKKLSKPMPEEITQEQKTIIRQQFIDAFCELYEKYCLTGQMTIMSLSLIYEVLIALYGRGLCLSELWVSQYLPVGFALLHALSF